MFFRIIDFKSAGAGILFFLTVFLVGMLWSFASYNGLADALSNHIKLIK